MVKAQLNEVIKTVSEALDNAGLSPAQIQELQMVGGSSCTPILLDMLEEIGFTRDKIKCQELKPELMNVIAKGAAIAGAQSNIKQWEWEEEKKPQEEEAKKAEDLPKENEMEEEQEYKPTTEQLSAIDEMIQYQAEAGPSDQQNDSEIADERVRRRF